MVYAATHITIRLTRRWDLIHVAQQQHQIFPAIDLNLSEKWEFNLP
jgi:hypothetical protein